MQLTTVLSQMPFFSGLSEEQLSGLAAIAVKKDVGRGQIIFYESAPAEGFYIVLSGRVKIYKTGPDGREAIIHLYGSGETFGEVAVFQNSSFPAHSEAVEKSSLAFFPRKGLLDCIAKDPALALAMLGAMSMKLRMFTKQVEALTLHEAPQRLASYLLYTSEEKNGAVTFKLDVSKGLLAGMLGTARETLSRTLSKMADRGLVSVEGRQITIEDMAALEDLAEGEIVL
ncbi:Crp/Fnr family transcriptional regulator [Halodesulfovibrio sp. MK-HDV]|jgi:CRP/FNR family transcriptional regulator, dissimilatory nitrate respiration regulator|uniref:Crp/Fnr family transcriptional regulator n=1 Tax=unclassified Halodesulfovibrio TaxID=2644657 RepID=UPI00136FC2B9|nr:Crp/Fnr family transcriptional regulator [Halodesulfovibrio sp. MK-HDV]KAF1073796.1 CRP-like cAMP-activated global transcriptional regulator [Halodesulfovibrio sp. MK-HDV]